MLVDNQIMSNFLYDYMTESERADAIRDMQFDNDIQVINNNLAILEMEHELHLKEIELRAITENYTEDDIYEMYKAEMMVYTEGVGDIFTGFITWLGNIIKAIFGIKPEPEYITVAKEEGATFEAPCNPHKVVAAVEAIPRAIGSLGNCIKEDGSIDKPKLLGSLGLQAALLGGAGLLSVEGLKKAFGGKTKITAEEAEKVSEELGKAADSTEDAIKKAANLDDNKKKTIMDFVKPIIEFARNIKNSILNWFKGFGKKTDGDNTEAKPEDKKDGEQKPEENKGEEKKPENKKDKATSKNDVPSNNNDGKKNDNIEGEKRLGLPFKSTIQAPGKVPLDEPQRKKDYESLYNKRQKKVAEYMKLSESDRKSNVGNQIANTIETIDIMMEQIKRGEAYESAYDDFDLDDYLTESTLDLDMFLESGNNDDLAELMRLVDSL